MSTTPPPGRAVAKDVARIAGVSQPTVSRAFDPDSKISTKTRQRVLQVADELGYLPNVIARSLSTNRTNIVGVVMANLTGSLFYAQLLELLAQRVQDMGKHLLLLNTPPGGSMDELLLRVVGYQVDALVIASTRSDDELVQPGDLTDRPVILLNRTTTDPRVHVVSCDNEAGGRLAADFLIDAGHERLGYVAGPETVSTSALRQRGFVDRVRERGGDVLIRDDNPYTYGAGCQAARDLLAADDPPDALFCAADIIALGLLDTARRELGVGVPDELSVIGFDDIHLAAWPTYDLTTVHQPVDDMVAAVTDLLQADSPSPAAVRLLPAELVVRGSARRPR